jgi:hypothetical protein
MTKKSVLDFIVDAAQLHVEAAGGLAFLDLNGKQAGRFERNKFLGVAVEEPHLLPLLDAAEAQVREWCGAGYGLAFLAAKDFEDTESATGGMEIARVTISMASNQVSLVCRDIMQAAVLELSEPTGSAH